MYLQKLLKVALLLLVCALFNNFLSAQENQEGTSTYYLHCGQLLDVESLNVLENMTVVVEGQRIKGIEKGFTPASDGVEIIDLKEATVMPGWIDLHVHLESQSSPKRYEEGFRMNKADIALRATQYAKRTLMAGFTTVRDVGGSGVNVSLKRAIDRGYVVGPRMFTSEKTIATTGGHGDPTNGLREDLMGRPGPEEGVGNSPDDLREAVRQRYKNGADMIKITATGGVLSVAKDGSGPQFTVEEVKAVVSTAQDYGFHVAAHAHGPEGMRRAIEGGVTSIEHGTLMTEEIMDLMVEKGTWLVPTLLAGQFVAEKAKIPGFYPSVIVPKALEIGPKLQQTFGKAYNKGVKIAFGTDSGVSYHGDNAREFELMVQAGMPAEEAFAAATIHAATVLGQQHELGQIKAGYLADIIAVKGNPLQDISLVYQLQLIMKEGQLYLQP